jgi:cysteine synthase
MNTSKKKAIIYLLGALATALGILWGMTSCTAVRTITTTAESKQVGDTSIVIQTRTIEQYTGVKNK